MVVCILYFIGLLRVNPWINPGDDQLHMLAQTEIFLLLLAGNVFYNLPNATFSDQDDCGHAATALPAHHRAGFSY